MSKRKEKWKKSKYFGKINTVRELKNKLYLLKKYDSLINRDLSEFDNFISGHPSQKTHYEFAKKVINAGKHLVIEKPFTATATDYSTIELEWSTFGMVNPVDNGVGDSNIFEIVALIHLL